MKRTFLILFTVCILVLPSIGLAATLSGVVLENESGSPLGASLILYKQNASGGWDFTGAEDTDATGHYGFSHLEAGKYYLECEAYTDCDPNVNYCADKYLPQLYDRVSIWDFDHKTQIVLTASEVKTLNPIRINTRPFYFDSIPINAVVLPSTGGTVKITTKVINKTSDVAIMLFWGDMEPPSRSDHSRFYDLWTVYPFAQNTWRLLKPGANTVTLTTTLGPQAPAGFYYYLAFGGSGFLGPKMPPMEGYFCKDISLSDCNDLYAAASPAKGIVKSAGRGKTIPTKLSADGKVLEKGPLKK
jgi:hypothetical protein